MCLPTPARIAAFSVAGLAVRTRNSDEAHPGTARIGALWDRFFSQSWERALPGRTDGGCLFGVYSAYESNEHGAFDLTAGVAVPPSPPVPGAARVDVQAGDYLVFAGAGPMPQLVANTWATVWHYFAQNPQLRRRYGTDFEAYDGPDRVRIHIGVHSPHS